MNVLRTRAEQLADYLRERIRKGELRDPLPGTRLWAEQLGVSRTTLKRVLRGLQRERLLNIQPRKPIRLTRHTRSGRLRAKPHLVRAMFSGAEYPDRSLFGWFPAVAERLADHGIQATMESSSFAQLRQVSREDPAREELLLLASIPAEYQHFFVPLRHRVLVTGWGTPGTELSYVTADTGGVVEHATAGLLRMGLRSLSLVHGQGKAAGVQHAIKVFQAQCADWPQAVRTEIVPLVLTDATLPRRVERYAARVRLGQGILVLEPAPAAMLINALLERGVSIRDGVQVRALLTFPGSLQFCRPPPQYPFPLQRFVRRVVQVVRRYFARGYLPPSREIVPVDYIPGN